MLRLPRLRKRTPQHEDLRFLIGRKRLDQHRGQRFPAAARMRAGLRAFNGKDRVQQQHALARPVFESSLHRWRAPEIALQLHKDIAQARRHLDAMRH